MARGWGERLLVGFLVFVLASLVLLVPSAWLAATISCSGEHPDSLSPARYCGYGAIYGVFIAPLLGVVVTAIYVSIDADRRAKDDHPEAEQAIVRPGMSGMVLGALLVSCSVIGLWLRPTKELFFVVIVLIGFGAAIFSIGWRQRTVARKQEGP